MNNPAFEELKYEVEIDSDAIIKLAKQRVAMVHREYQLEELDISNLKVVAFSRIGEAFRVTIITQKRDGLQYEVSAPSRGVELSVDTYKKIHTGKY